jgi:hypothetical protein
MGLVPVVELDFNTMSILSFSNSSSAFFMLWPALDAWRDWRMRGDMRWEVALGVGVKSDVPEYEMGIGGVGFDTERLASCVCDGGGGGGALRGGKGGVWFDGGEELRDLARVRKGLL